METDRTKPEFEAGFCCPTCPYINVYEHPHFEHTAWCEYTECELDWYKYWIASCQTN